jgi:hypothetical protein
VVPLTSREENASGWPVESRTYPLTSAAFAEAERTNTMKQARKKRSISQQRIDVAKVTDRLQK